VCTFSSPISGQVRNVTQTSVTLEWEPITLATAKIRSLDIYRNGERLSAVPSVLTNTTTKHSGMEINTEYSFQLILRTTAGTYPSNLIRVRTHTMQDTSGICVCFGNVQDPVLLENSKLALREMGAKWTEKIQIDTSHFVCTTAAATPGGVSPSPGTSGGPSVEYQRALQLSIPIVQPYWILACHSEKRYAFLFNISAPIYLNGWILRMIPIANFYLGVSTPSSAGFNRPVSMSQASLPRSPVSPPPNQSNKQVPSSYRASMPVPSRIPDTPPSHASAFIGQPSSARGPNSSRTLDTPGEELEHDPELQTAKLEKRKSRTGSINMDFRFPQLSTPEAAASMSAPEDKGEAPKKDTAETQHTTQHARKPSAIEVPAPPPVEKEASFSTVSLAESTDDEVGPTVEIDL